MSSTLGTLRLFKVTADRQTGEWLSKEEIGTVKATDHYAKHDTKDVHYDTFELPHPTEDGLIEDETCACEVHWITEAA